MHAYFMQPCYVTRSAKTEHYSAIQIFQYNTLGKKMRILKKICQLIYPPFSWWRKEPTVKTWVLSYLPKQEKLENLWLQSTKRFVSYGRLFTWCRSSRSQSMFLHGFWLCLRWCRAVEEITYPVINSSVHGEHDGAKFESLPHSIHKLHLF